ncbi:MAG TPA: SRPBCC family protein [Natronosporangium sp.]|nr:SRPBCC family protein [Natronosporangium sp.]
MGNTEVIVEPGRHDIVIKRVFNAPPEKVFQALIDPEKIARWWGPRRYDTIVEHLDARNGGSWRFRNRDEQGNEYTFRGVFHDVTPPERLAQTFEYEAMPGHVSLESATLEPIDGGRTRYTAVSVFPSVEDRDGMAQSGMQEGASESMDRLAELVEQ